MLAGSLACWVVSTHAPCSDFLMSLLDSFTVILYCYTGCCPPSLLPTGSGMQPAAYWGGGGSRLAGQMADTFVGLVAKEASSAAPVRCRRGASCAAAGAAAGTGGGMPPCACREAAAAAEAGATGVHMLLPGLEPGAPRLGALLPSRPSRNICARCSACCSSVSTSCVEESMPSACGTAARNQQNEGTACTASDQQASRQSILLRRSRGCWKHALADPGRCMPGAHLRADAPLPAG